MHNYDEIKSKQNIFDVDWTLGSLCNYSCSYCVPWFNDGKNKFVDINNAKKFINIIMDKHPNRIFNFILTGGEPTLWQELPELLKLIKQKKSNNVQLITNGSQSIKWWLSNSKLIDSILLSYHLKYANKEHLKRVCSIVYKSKCNIKLTILTMPDRIDECYDLADEFLKHTMMKIELRIIKKPNGEPLDEYTQEQLTLLRTKNIFGKFKHRTIIQHMITNEGETIDPMRELLNPINSWKGWKCYIGLDCLKIDYKGDIYRSGCDSQNAISLGNIHTNIYNIPNEPVICKNNVCFCATDMRAKKERIREGL